jgi:hypothetical protein
VLPIHSEWATSTADNGGSHVLTSPTRYVIAHTDGSSFLKIIMKLDGSGLYGPVGCISQRIKVQVF